MKASTVTPELPLAQRVVARTAVPQRLPAGLLRTAWDAPLLALAGAQALVLWLLPNFLTVALGVWWCSNTVAHFAVHRSFFRWRGLDELFSIYLSALLGIPQEIWRARHLAHHAGVAPRIRRSRLLLCQLAAIAAVWGSLLAFAPEVFLLHYLPGSALGLGICQLHGRYEHSRGAVSHYGALYNLLFFNDGYHVEHHRTPGLHWRELPKSANEADRPAASRWPAPLRWLEGKPLELLERLALRRGWIQRFVLRAHERALAKLLAGEQPQRVAIVGGGLFPRSAQLLSRLLPRAKLVVIDGERRHLEIAAAALGESAAARLELVEGWFDPRRHQGFDLIVFPLSYQGDRQGLYASPPAPLVLVHDWIWSRRGERGAVVSWLLLKRLNLVRAGAS